VLEARAIARVASIPSGSYAWSRRSGRTRERRAKRVKKRTRSRRERTGSRKDVERNNDSRYWRLQGIASISVGRAR